MTQFAFMSPAAEEQTPPVRDWQTGLLLAVLGIGLRVAWVLYWRPTPVSDFAGIIEFASRLATLGPFSPGYYWDNFNPALPLFLSLVFRLIPADPVVVARLATAVATGLLPLLPWLLWARVLPRRLRLASGVLLALWPGQVVSSGVVGQDVWVALPTVALGCLAVRRLAGGAVSPVAVGVVWALAGATRQEMLLITSPLVLAACLGAGPWRARAQRLVVCGVAMAALFVGFAAVRWRATGAFRVTSVHAGYTLLGTVAPGATTNFWMDPASYVATVEPDLTGDRHRLMLEAGRLAHAELVRRPVFQLARTAAATSWFATRSDADLLQWSLSSPGVLAEPRRVAGGRLAERLTPWLDLAQIGLLAGLLYGGLWTVVDRRALLVAPLLAIGAKHLLHGFLVAQGRFLVPVVLLGVAVLPLAVAVGGRRRWGVLAAAAALALGSAALIHQGGARLRSEVVARDPVRQQTYRYVLRPWGNATTLNCLTTQGAVVLLGADSAQIESITGPTGEVSPSAHCTLGGPPGGGVDLRIEAPSPTIALDDKVVAPRAEPLTLLVPADGGERSLDLGLVPTTDPSVRQQMRLLVAPPTPESLAPDIR
jgi:hypothetical protein